MAATKPKAEKPKAAKKEVIVTDKAVKVPANSTLRTISKKADEWKELNKKRLALQKEVDKLEAKEKELKEFLIDNISANDSTGVSGKLVRVWVDRENVPVVEDADKLRAYLNKSKRYDLCQALKPVKAAVEEMWQSGKTIPGVGHIQVKKLRSSIVK